MNKAGKIVLAILLVAALLYAAILFVPLLLWGSEGTNDRWMVANSLLYTLLHLGAAILLLFGASAYKEAMRAAYIKIASGVVLAGLGLAQVIFITALGLLESPWVQYGGVMLPFVAAGLLVYFGTRAMAVLVGVTSPLTKIRFVLPCLLLALVVAWLLPHAAPALPEVYFDISNAISVWDIVLYAASLGLVLQIKSHSGAYYAESMRWLAAGLAGSVVITTSLLVGTFVVGKTPAGVLLDAFVITGGLVYLRAGYSFAKTKEL